jgi:hypothetical protein
MRRRELITLVGGVPDYVAAVGAGAAVGDACGRFSRKRTARLIRGPVACVPPSLARASSGFGRLMQARRFPAALVESAYYAKDSRKEHSESTK